MAEKRTKKIKISENDELPNIEESPLEHAVNPDGNQHYELHIEAADSPARKPVKAPNKAVGKSATESTKTKSPKVTPPKSTSKIKIPKKSAPLLQSNKVIPTHTPKKTSTGRKVKNRIWNTLEWVATTALIFMVLFFAMNFGSYSELFKHKVEQVTGGFKVNPYIEKIFTEGEEEVTQDLLPLEADQTKVAEVVPPLTMEIAPPDDRIIIPRINKNVPVVDVKTENLVRRDWTALEKDIQVALKDGVVHYPGTAQAGDQGNVVITGHSSYFPWDPGRFKDVFALLHEIVVKDRIIVYHDQIKYEYEVYDKQVVLPDQIEVLTQEGEDRLTLITCTPVGTNLKRLIIFASPV